MAAVAQLKAPVQRRAAGTRRRVAGRTRARRKARLDTRHLSSLILGVIALAFLFGYVSVYARLTVAGYNRSKLVETCRAERLKNERLKVRWNALSSPNYVVSAAEKAGMVYATQYDYLRPPEKLARLTRAAGN